MTQANAAQGWPSFFAGWQFRSATPRFEPGAEIESYLTDYDASAARGEARIGDTILTVHAADPAQIERIVILRIDSFDPNAHTGEATVIQAVEPTAP